MEEVYVEDIPVYTQVTLVAKVHKQESVGGESIWKGLVELNPRAG